MLPWRAHAERLSPCSERRPARSAARVGGHERAPPSNVVMFLVAWKEKAVRLPCEPTGRPCQRAPIACARVLHHGDPVTVAERVDGVEVDREAGEVDRHHGPGPRA